MSSDYAPTASDMATAADEDYDAIVVGAGLAGLVAAHELSLAGKRVLILDQENRANLGGQAFWSLGGLFLVEARDGKCTSLNKEEAHEHIATPARRQCSSRPDRPFDGLPGLRADRS